MWVKRFQNEALVGCKSSPQTTWVLKCNKALWEGQVGICSPVSNSIQSSAPEQPKNKGK